MKKLFGFALAAMFAVTALVISSCSDSDTTDTPVVPELSLTERGFDVTEAGGEFTLHVISNVAWSVSVDCGEAEPWVTVSPAQGSGEAEVAVKVSPYNGMEGRTATVSVSVEGVAPQSVVVSQSAAKVAKVDVTELSAAQAGETLTINVTANKAWTLAFESEVDWAALAIGEATPAQSVSGDGSAAVTVVVAENAGYAERSAALLFTAEGEDDISIPLAQAGVPALTVAEALAKVDGDGVESWSGAVGEVLVYAVSEDGYVVGDDTGAVLVRSATTQTVKVGDKLRIDGTLAVVWEIGAKVFTEETVATQLSSGNSLPAMTPVSEDYEQWIMDIISGGGIINGAQYVKIVGNQGVKEVRVYDEVNDEFTDEVLTYQVVRNPEWVYAASHTPYAKTNAELLAAKEGQGVTVYGWVVIAEALDPMSWGGGSEMAVYVDRVEDSPKVVGKPEITLDKSELKLTAAGMTGAGETNFVVARVKNLGDYTLTAEASHPFSAIVESNDDVLGGDASTSTFIVAVEAPANQSSEPISGTLTISVGDAANSVATATVNLTQAGAVSGNVATIIFDEHFAANEVVLFETNSPMYMAATSGGDEISLTFTKVSSKSGYQTGWQNGTSTSIKGLTILNGDAFTISSKSGGVTIKRVEVFGGYYNTANIATTVAGEVTTESSVVRADDPSTTGVNEEINTYAWVWSGETTSLPLKHNTNKYGSVKAIRVTYAE